MAGSVGWLLRLMAAATVVVALVAGSAGARPAWAGTVPDAVAQQDDEDEEEVDDTDDQAGDEDDADDEDDAEPDDDEETYESPLYGYTLTYDSAEWEVLQEDEDSDDDYDQLFLTNGVSIVGLTGDPDYADDELADCVDDYIGGLENEDSASDIDLLDEQDAEGEDDDRVWQTVTYTWEVEDGEEDYIRYFECRWLGDDLTLVILHDTLDADYEDEIEAREELLEGFSPPEGDTDDEDDADTDAGGADEEDDRDDADEDQDDTAGGDEDEDDENLLAEVEEYEADDISHTDDPVEYEQTPPVGGAHGPVWQDCGFYDEPIVAESAVHSLEHGAVWITYDPDLTADEVEILEELADSESYVLVSPFEDLPSPVVASAWAVQLELDGADDPRLEAFVEFYAEGPQTPELGAPCLGGTSETA